MKFAIVNDERQEAQPNLFGLCPTCSRPMIAKCGEIKIWHWAHRASRLCDPWWENETEWHRAWKNQFPVSWQEVVLKAENGEKHIADVKTDYGWVIEFQHSYIKPEERQSRNNFYSKLTWVVDGTRRKRDRSQFLRALDDGIQLYPNLPIHRIFSEDSSLLQEWADTSASVFFDFGPGPSLWWIFTKGTKGYLYGVPFSRSLFIEIYKDGASKKAEEFNDLVEKLVVSYESRLGEQASRQLTPQLVLRPRNRTKRRL
jgi:competence protein CoiA